MFGRKVYLYAFDRACKLQGYRYFQGNDITVGNIREYANWMLDYLGSTCKVYIVDNYPGLYRDYCESLKSTSFEKHVEFEDLISRRGLLIANR